MRIFLMFLALATSMPNAALAGKLSFVINGKSFHSSSSYQVVNTNINYLCDSPTPQNLDPSQIPSDCHEASRNVTTEEKKYNEDNRGYGFIYEFDQYKKFIPYVTAGKYLDSFNTGAKYISGGLNKRILLGKNLDNLHFKYGGVISVIQSPSYIEGKPLVTFMPVIGIGTDAIGVNLSYVPKINNDTTHVFFLQLETTLSK